MYELQGRRGHISVPSKCHHIVGSSVEHHFELGLMLHRAFLDDALYDDGD